jgi:hypothetical protein
MELLFWIYLLSLASKKQSETIRFSHTHATRIGRFNELEIETAITKLVELECIKLHENIRTRTLRAQPTTRRDEINTFAGNSSGEIASDDLEKENQAISKHMDGRFPSGSARSAKKALIKIRGEK